MLSSTSSGKYPHPCDNLVVGLISSLIGDSILRRVEGGCLGDLTLWRVVDDGGWISDLSIVRSGDIEAGLYVRVKVCIP